jgi:hypothetical protein
MNLEKREALEQTYKAAIQIGWFDGSLDAIAEYFVEDFLLYGTGYHEKAQSRDEFRDMIAVQRMQSEDTQFEAGMGTTFIVCIPNNQ